MKNAKITHVCLSIYKEIRTNVYIVFSGNTAVTQTIVMFRMEWEMQL